MEIKVEVRGEAGGFVGSWWAAEPSSDDQRRVGAVRQAREPPRERFDSTPPTPFGGLSRIAIRSTVIEFDPVPRPIHMIAVAIFRHLLRFLNRLAGYKSAYSFVTASITLATVRSTVSGMLSFTPAKVKPV